MTDSRTGLQARPSEPPREPAEEIARQSRLVESMPLVRTLLDALPGGVVLLNDRRQAVAVNRAVLAMVGRPCQDLLGLRLGEIFGCPFSGEGPDGCGTSQQCKNCGSLQALIACRTYHGPARGECSLTVDRPHKGGSLELRVQATPVAIAGESLTLCTLEDASQQNRLAEMSAIFFHDVLNLVGGIHGHLDLLTPHVPAGEAREDLQRLRWLADQLADEIEAQRDLMLAAAGGLVVQPQVIRTAALVEDLRRVYARHAVGAERTITARDVWDGIIVTDVRLLARVLGNMLHNALEATSAGGTVTLGCQPGDGDVLFTVHNAATIPEHLQQQLFKRAFTTKGRAGRGVGVRSMKLLGENYLGGTVSFLSCPATGTIFTLRVPKVLDAGRDD